MRADDLVRPAQPSDTRSDSVRRVSDQHVGGEPKPAAIVLEPDLLAMVVVVAGGVGLLMGVLKTLSGWGSQRSGMDRLLPSEVELAAKRRTPRVEDGQPGSQWRCRHPPSG